MVSVQIKAESGVQEMSTIKNWFQPIPCTLQELLGAEEREAPLRVLEAARRAQADLKNLLPNDRKLVIDAIVKLPSSRPLMKDGKLDQFELTRRLIRLLESSRAAIHATSEKPRPRRDKGGGPKGRAPTPGTYSGARREPSTAWHGELRS